MGYYNPVLRYGLKEFAQAGAKAGLDGVIVPDLPPEESGPLTGECAPKGIAVIPLVAPTSTDSRIEKACKNARGFIYCVSVAGVTGARDAVAPGVFELLERVRRCTSLPRAVGFGISRRQHVEAIGRRAEAVVVGSALVRVVQEAPVGKMVDQARRFVAGLTGRVQ
jgi:tryptophan synthase alpha chain